MDYSQLFDNIIDLIINMPGGDRDAFDFFEFVAEHVKGAKQGRCDATGGMEFRRSIKEWFENGKPRPIPSYLCGTPTSKNVEIKNAIHHLEAATKLLKRLDEVLDVLQVKIDK